MKQTGWLIYSKADAFANKSYINWFIVEAEKQSIELKLMLREELEIGIIEGKRVILWKKQCIPIPTFAIVRTIEPLLSFHIESLGVPVFNSAKIAAICNNKALTYLEINKLGVPMVDTLFVDRKNILSTPPMPYPFVVKSAKGRGGKEVFFIENTVQWQACVQKLTNQLVIQASNVLLGKDIRVFVVGNEIIGAVLRESKTDFRANYKLGGTAKWYSLNEKESEMVKQIIQHFDFGMVGIDFLLDHNGNLLFNEIEDVVGSRTLSAVSNINILQKYINHIKLSISTNHF